MLSSHVTIDDDSFGVLYCTYTFLCVPTVVMVILDHLVIVPIIVPTNKYIVLYSDRGNRRKHKQSYYHGCSLPVYHQKNSVFPPPTKCFLLSSYIHPRRYVWYCLRCLLCVGVERSGDGDLFPPIDPLLCIVIRVHHYEPDMVFALSNIASPVKNSGP